MPGLFRSRSKSPLVTDRIRSDTIPTGDRTGNNLRRVKMSEKMDTYPVEAVVTAKEKRYDPIKHYAFIVEVKWSDNSCIPIYRRYSDFAQLHTDVSDFINSCPEHKRHQMPHFPSKKVFQRGEISKNASIRRHAFGDYCQGLLMMDKVISQHKIVKAFFKARETDINPLTQSQTRAGKGRSSLLQALSILVPGSKKQNDGSSGNIRHSRSSGDLSQFSEEDDPIYVSSPIVCESYTAVADYTPQGNGEIKLKEGQVVEVVEKYPNGWWFVQTEYGFGWTPATYLTPVTEKKPSDEDDEPEPVYSGHQYITTRAYTAELDDEVTFDEGVLVKVLHKLLDGWWIISYQEEVGYAPATYLVSFLNPYFRDSRHGQQQNRKPTTRRRTIQNGSGKYIKDGKERDLSLYKKINNKVDNINKKREELQSKKPAEDQREKVTKPMEYEYLDEEEMASVQQWAENQRRGSVSSTTSSIGPPLPPRPPSLSSTAHVFTNSVSINTSTSPRRQSVDGSGLVYVKKKQAQTYPRESKYDNAENLNQGSRKLPPNERMFNKAPPSPRQRRKSAFPAFTDHGDSNGIKPRMDERKLRLSVPEILITGCDDFGNKMTGEDSSSSDEETVESLYSTLKDVEPRRASLEQASDEGSSAGTGRRGGEEAASESGDSSSDDEETVESLYGQTSDVRTLIRTRVQSSLGPIEYTHVNKADNAKPQGDADSDEYVPMNQCSQRGHENNPMAEHHEQCESRADIPEHIMVVEERKQGSGAEGSSGVENVEKSSAHEGELVTGKTAMNTLIDSLKSKTIDGVYTNDKGELCIKFDKSLGSNV